MGLPAVAAAFSTALNLVGSVNDALRKAVPQIEDEVTVEVAGQPGASKQKLYYLALAAANGVVRRLASLNSIITPGFGLLMIEYDAASDWVRCTLKYRWSMTTVNVLTAVSDKGKSFYNRMAVYRGPQCDVNGGSFDFVSSELKVALGGGFGLVPTHLPVPGIPRSSTDPNVPQLPFAGQPILTSCPVSQPPTPGDVREDPAPSFALAAERAKIPSPNPKPPGDNRSRGAVVVPPGALGGIGGPGFAPLPAGILPQLSGVTRPGEKGKCCDKADALIPLVFAALSPAGTSTEMVFPVPKPGADGG